MHTLPRILTIALAAAGLAACTSAYTGPVEVTRFVAQDQTALGQGPIVIYFPDEISNQNAKAAIGTAVQAELRALGYSIVDQEGPGIQVAAIRTSRNPITAATRSRGPVSVGVGAGTGSYGSGVGVGLGIDLGGGRSAPNAISELSVRITAPGGQTLWEGRANQAISVDSPYADVDASARALSAALFRDFPGGNGETVTIEVDDLAQN